nr:PREDICTED: uncharacterized protein LOC104640042 [Balearica regulorum gibbericeps]
MLSSGLEPSLYFVSWIPRKSVRRARCLSLEWMLTLLAVVQFALEVSVTRSVPISVPRTEDSSLPRLPALPFEAVQPSNRCNSGGPKVEVGSKRGPSLTAKSQYTHIREVLWLLLVKMKSFMSGSLGYQLEFWCAADTALGQSGKNLAWGDSTFGAGADHSPPSAQYMENKINNVKLRSVSIFRNQVILYGDLPKNKENVIYLSNHQCTVDWIIADMLAIRQNALGHVRYVLKDGLKWLPLYGWYFSQHGGVYVKRSAKFNEKEMREKLRAQMKAETPMYLVIFPEGTRYNPEIPKVIADSQSFAEKEGT